MKLYKLSKKELARIVDANLHMIPHYNRVCITTSIPLENNTRSCLEHVVKYNCNI